MTETPQNTETTWLRRSLAVTSVETVAHEVVAVTLGDPEGGPLPTWQPGSHLDIELQQGLVRQYSLCGDPSDTSSWTVAVRLEAAGRGGSRYVHSTLRAGQHVRVAGPRQHFALEPAADYLLVAGGIGITPLLVMAEDLHRRGARAHLVYFGRGLPHMAFVDRAQAVGATIVVRDSTPLTLADLVRDHDATELVYGCGPDRLLEELTRLVPTGRLRTERFTAAVPPLDENVGGETGEADPAAGVAPGADAAFEVQLGHEGPVLEVPAHESMLDVLLAEGVDLMWSCREGNCASCEVRVLAGRPDHRDVILTDDERAADDVMFPCVSRARCDRLVIDVP